MGCKRVFSNKLQPNGTVKSYKVRLLVKGYTQIYGVYYQEMFSPVIKTNFIHILISVATNQGWPLLQLDFKNTFLYRDLEERVYTRLPLRFQHSTGK